MQPAAAQGTCCKQLPQAAAASSGSPGVSRHSVSPRSCRCHNRTSAPPWSAAACTCRTCNPAHTCTCPSGRGRGAAARPASSLRPRCAAASAAARSCAFRSRRRAPLDCQGPAHRTFSAATRPGKRSGRCAPAGGAAGGAGRDGGARGVSVCTPQIRARAGAAGGGGKARRAARGLPPVAAPAAAALLLHCTLCLVT